MKLYRVIFPVSDIERAVDFYSSVFEMKGVRVSPGRHYFNLGGTILSIYDPVADGDDIGTPIVLHENQYIYISTENIEKVHASFGKFSGAAVDPSIETMPWGERLFYTVDPFGNRICFVDEKTVFTGQEVYGY